VPGRGIVAALVAPLAPLPFVVLAPAACSRLTISRAATPSSMLSELSIFEVIEFTLLSVFSSVWVGNLSWTVVGCLGLQGTRVAYTNYSAVNLAVWEEVHVCIHLGPVACNIKSRDERPE
jgi:Na+/serine symporter